MNKTASNNPDTDSIRALLNKHGIGQRQHAKVVAEIIGLGYVSTSQKFAGIRGWSAGQLKLIAQHFSNLPADAANTPSAPTEQQGVATAPWNAVLSVSNIPQRCSLQHGDIARQPEAENLVAIDDAEGWTVIPGAKAEAGRTAYKVAKMEVFPAPRIAALDDNAEIPSAIAGMFAHHGMQVSSFSDPDSMLAVLQAQVQAFEGYILDWALGAGKTAEPVIVFIRQTLKSNAPITILTGELRTLGTNGSDIARMAQSYGVAVLEKPAMLEMLAGTFYNKLFRMNGTY